MNQEPSQNEPSSNEPSDFLSRIVKLFLESQLSLILILVSLVLGFAALWITPREEDPQIVVPLADIYVSFPGHRAAEVEQLVASPLERILYQIDGVEYVYSMSRDDAAIITVRFYVGQDRERSLVKLFKKLNENIDTIPREVAGWVMKPVEIDDVPIVTMALQGADGDSFTLRRIGEELVERLASVPNVSRAFLVGGQPRTISIDLDPDRLRSYRMGLLEVKKAIAASNAASSSSTATRLDQEFQIAVHPPLASAADVGNLVVGVVDQRPVYLKDIANISDGPDEVIDYVRHGWGAAKEFEHHAWSPGWVIGSSQEHSVSDHSSQEENGAGSRGSQPAVVLAIAKQRGANAVQVADAVLREANRLRSEIVPDNVEWIVTRNNGIVANEKVNELIEALGVAIFIVILLLTFGLGWREALIVCIAVPVVFGLTLAVNLLLGYSINRVTLFALILALGLLVDDPIVDVENIARHFEHRKRATKKIVLEAVAEIRPPLISATLAVIVSFLPMFFITGLMGPYMSPMALNVPVAMGMSMLVAFTITPWLSYHILTWGKPHSQHASEEVVVPDNLGEAYDPEAVRQTRLYRFFRPLMLPLLKNRFRAVVFLLLMAGLTLAAMSLGALRLVPLKMLPFDNKNELLFVIDMEEG
nr:efflux RND transporter permease subunit [Pirellula sp.]